jgi:hypothetical protein
LAPRCAAPGGAKMIAAAGRAGRIYAVGGLNQAGDAVATLEIYEPPPQHLPDQSPDPDPNGVLDDTRLRGNENDYSRLRLGSVRKRALPYRAF